MTTYLLDTHVFNWFRIAPEKLGPKTLAQLTAARTRCAISVVGALEVAQLVYKGRLVLPCDVEIWMHECCRLFQCRERPLTARIAAEAYRLPGDFHPDPADRLLAATARMENFTLLTADRRILEYPHVSTADARK